MRRLATLCMALIGTGVALPAAARAGQPADFPTSHGGPATVSGVPVMAGPDTSRHNKPHTRYCPKCQLDRAQRHAGNNTLIVNGPGGTDGSCASCGDGAVIVGEAPGVAMLGPGTTSIVSPEPAPIGVVQAGFRPPSVGAPPAMAGMPGRSPHPSFVPPPQTPIGGAVHRRPSVIGHLLGLDGLGHLGAARRERRAAAHAAIPVGNVGARSLNELPASFVYGR